MPDLPEAEINILEETEQYLECMGMFLRSMKFKFVAALSKDSKIQCDVGLINVGDPLGSFNHTELMEDLIERLGYREDYSWQIPLKDPRLVDLIVGGGSLGARKSRGDIGLQDAAFDSNGLKIEIGRNSPKEETVERAVLTALNDWRDEMVRIVFGDTSL